VELQHLGHSDGERAQRVPGGRQPPRHGRHCTAKPPTSSLRSSTASAGFSSSSSPCKRGGQQPRQLPLPGGGLPARQGPRSPAETRAAAAPRYLQPQHGSLLGGPPVVSDHEGIVLPRRVRVLHEAVPRGIVDDLWEEEGSGAAPRSPRAGRGRALPLTHKGEGGMYFFQLL